MEVQWRPDGRRCRHASASLASDHYLLAPHKISLWDTPLCVLGRDIGTVAMTNSVPLKKLERLRDTLNEWSPDRVVASEEELRSLIGRLLTVDICRGMAVVYIRSFAESTMIRPKVGE